MMDVQKGQFFFECDGCGEVLETKRKFFEDAKAELKDAEWRTERAGTDERGKPVWKHFCPDC